LGSADDNSQPAPQPDHPNLVVDTGFNSILYLNVHQEIRERIINFHLLTGLHILFVTTGFKFQLGVVRFVLLSAVISLIAFRGLIKWILDDLIFKNLLAGALEENGDASASGDQPAAANFPAGGAEWIDLFVREMTCATSVDDARSRAARLLEVLEKSITAHASSGVTTALQRVFVCATIAFINCTW